jgi:DNA topoisomerase-2
MSKQKYVKKTHLEQIISRPTMYIGSVNPDIHNIWHFDSVSEEMKKKDLTFTPGYYKIFDELIVNILDHLIRIKEEKLENEVKTIKVVVDKEKGYIEVYNDGDGIDIKLNEKENVYDPELIFGHLLTSSNYDDKKERKIGGMNGYGAKLCNIFSTKFIIETVDSYRKLHYKQIFTKNMKEKTKPIIKDSEKYPFTKIKYYPDYEKFGMSEAITDDAYLLLMKRVYDVAGLTESNVKVYFNGKQIKVANFKKYCDLYLVNIDNNDIVYDKINDSWEIVVAKSPLKVATNISFVNGIWTMKGGKHLDLIVKNIIEKFKKSILAKNKNITIKDSNLKDLLFVAVRSTIINPDFDSQTKDTLITPISKFGSKPVISDELIKKLMKTSIVEEIVNISQVQSIKDLKKTDGKKKANIFGIPKLEDAIWAGTKKSQECTLILTEGDSAKAMVMAGLSIVGRQKYGVFPLKGKLLNVRDESITKIKDNEEINNLKIIMGLQTGMEYDDISTLRYGRIMCLTDADEDGHHIKGLLFNLFSSLWPSLLRHKNFICSMLTPIVKVSYKKDILSFYNLRDYAKWKESINNSSYWNIKYYKGLGTSTSNEGKEYFKTMKLVNYSFENKTIDCLDMAFNKKRADDRKLWLTEFSNNKREYNNDKDDISYSEFIDNELIYFSYYDIQRSIPSICDGLKISLRKILYCCFKRKLHSEVKVAQLSGYVSEHSNYHHGEASLQGAIIGMAQNYVGSNNINILMPEGQFGSRLKMGKDHASPRYIYTYLNPIVMHIYIKDDFNILNHINDDGQIVEPEFYLPIIPMILVNGGIGIATGYSTFIPNYDILNICEILKGLLKANTEERYKKVLKATNKMFPYYEGFKGDIVKISTYSYKTYGIYKKIGENKLEITELPIGCSTEKYKEELDKYVNWENLEKDDKKKNDKKKTNKFDKYKNILKKYDNHSTDINVKFVLDFYPGILSKLLQDTDDFIAKFKLSSSLSINNMNLLDENSKLQKFNSLENIFDFFYNFRLKWYQVRKDYLIDNLNNELIYIDAKIRFIMDIIEERLEIRNIPKKNIEEYLFKEKYPDKNENWDYLIKMPLWNLTLEKKEEFIKEMENKKEILYNIQNKSIKDMWLDELNTFEEEYKKIYKR